jgi:hypothetical protein
VTTVGLDADSVVAHAHKLVVEEFDDGVVVWDGPSECLHRLDGPGALIWDLLDGGRSLGEVAADVGRLFGLDPEHVRGDVHAFVTDLVERQLVHVVHLD